MEDESYAVWQDGAEEEPFKIERGGKWRFVAWEAPSIPGEPPVLWISDALGLRAFLPPGCERTFESGDGAATEDAEGDDR